MRCQVGKCEQINEIGKEDTWDWCGFGGDGELEESSGLNEEEIGV